MRVKPLKEEECINPKNNHWEVNDNILWNTENNEQYAFDWVYGSNSSTWDIYNESIKDLIKSTIEGMNATIFAYGQTASGKTYTMKGS